MANPRLKPTTKVGQANARQARASDICIKLKPESERENAGPFGHSNSRRDKGETEVVLARGPVQTVKLLGIRGGAVSHVHRAADDSDRKADGDVGEPFLRAAIKTQCAQTQDGPPEAREYDRRQLLARPSGHGARPGRFGLRSLRGRRRGRGLLRQPLSGKANGQDEDGYDHINFI